MLRYWIAITLVSVGCHKSNKPKEQLQAGDLAFVGATVVPMNREGTLADQTVVVRGDKIVRVAPASTFDTKNATVIDAHGKWIVPGLADMHIHTWVDHDFSMYLLNGVTTVRDMFGSPQHLKWRSDIAAGKLDGPTLITAGPIVDGDPPVWPGSAVVTTPDAARQVVRDQKQAGYDFIKVYNGLSQESYDAIADEAKKQGIWFAGHVPKAVAIEKAIASGQRTIEHLDGYIPFAGEAHVSPEIVAATAKSGVWNCPTLVVMDRFGHLDDPAGLASTPGLEYVSAPVRAQWDPKNDFRLAKWTPEMFAKTRERNEIGHKLVADLQKAGAHLVLGTDTGNPYVVPGFAVHDELALLVKSGLTPWQAIRMATAAPAELLEKPGSFGVVAEGARADLVMVDADPLKNVGALANPPLVVVRGKVHKHDELLAAVTAKPADPMASLPEIEVEGEKLAAAHYDVVLNGTVIGHERALISKLADGTPVVRGQAAYVSPQAVFQYRATPDGVEFIDGLTVARDKTKVIAKPKSGPPIELATTADAVIAPQTIAEFVWYARKLDKAAVGSSTTIDAAEVMVENAVSLEPARFTFKRLPDAGGRKSYEVTGKNGKLDLTGKFTVDPDGAPHDVEATVKFGTFTTKRVD